MNRKNKELKTVGEKRRIIPKPLGRGENRRFGLREKKTNDELTRNRNT